MRHKRRHTTPEIAAKLREAHVMAAGGQTQREIAEALGISVMTFHRWRRSHPIAASEHLPPAETSPLGGSAGNEPTERLNRISELQEENTRLRKLVTDLLLEKMRLEEEGRWLSGNEVRNAPR